MIKIEDIQEGSLWYEVRGKKFLWRLRFYNPNTKSEDKVSITLNSNSSQAKTKARQLLLKKAKAKIDEEVNILDPNLSITSFCFEEVANIWIDDSQTKLKPSTLIQRKRIIKLFCKKFGEQPMSEFTVFQLQNYFNRLKLKKSTINIYFQVMKLFFDFAERMEIIENNVLKKVRITYPRKTIEDYQKLERKFFTWSDLSFVFEEMSKSSNPQTQRIKLILEFLFLTGLRYCELAALKVENYDTDNKVISIESDIDYSEGISKKRHVTTKTLSSYRRVPLTGRAIDIIEQIISENQRNISYGYSDYGYIFTSRTGNPWSISGINRSFRNFGKRTGLDKQFSCHCMRHSHISLLAELEVSQKAVMQRVGHSSSRITNEIYTHVTPKMNQKLLEKLNSFSGQKVVKTE